MKRSSFVLAVDVGQANDYTALSILQSYETREPGAWPAPRLLRS